jgi:hypothetical protein
LSLLLGATLTGCAAPEVEPPTRPELDAVAKAVLHEAVYINTLLQRCGEFDSNLAQQTERLEQRWLEHNGALLAGADAHYSDMLTGKTYRYQGEPLALEAILLTQQARTKALDEVKCERRSLNNRLVFCQRRLEGMAQQTPIMEFGEGERTQLTVQSLIAMQPGARPILNEVPSLADHIDCNQDPGPSYFRELQNVQKDYPDAKLLVIHHDWPSEAYGAYCEGAPLAFITCQWGECSSQ